MGAEGNPPAPSISPGGANFDGIVLATAAATAAVLAVTAVAATTARTFLRSRGDLRGTCRFSASSLHCKADAQYPSRGLDHKRVLRGCPVGVCHEDVEAWKILKGKVVKIERAHDSLLEECLEKERYVARGAREAWCAIRLKISSYLNGP